MRTLYLLRHAKAERAGVADLERTLAKRGRRDAPAMGAYMRRREYRPALILCSPAARTRETLELLQPELGGDAPAEFDRKLYPGEPGTVLKRLQAVDEAFDSVLVVGHNPGLAQLAAALAPRGEKRALARMREKYPTCGLAVIHLHVDRWEQAAPGSGTLTDFMAPKELPSS
jgi:phosphohistidine phosphatase